MASSQEDEWRWMVDQDSHSWSVTGDSGHGTMAATGEDEPIESTEELVGAVGESMKVSPLSISLMFNGEMMTPCLCLMTRMSQSPRPQLLPRPQFRHVKKKTKLFPHSNHHLGKSLAFES